MKIEMCETTGWTIFGVALCVFLTIAVCSIAGCAGRVYGPPDQSPTRSPNPPVAGRNAVQ